MGIFGGRDELQINVPNWICRRERKTSLSEVRYKVHRDDDYEV